MGNVLHARPFVVEDWPWVAAWFEDDTLNRTLGPLDEEWVEYVTHETDGVQLVLSSDRGPVALIGIIWDPDGVRHVLTDMAVDPARRGEGLGRVALASAMTWPGHPSAGGWAAYVDPANRAAYKFLTALGWRDCGLDHDMHRFVSPG